MKATLIGAFGRIDLGPVRLTIGRAPNNQIVLNDPRVSGYHAEILPEGEGYSIIDLGSRNGTFVNDYRLAPQIPHPLKPNDRLGFGQLMGNSTTSCTYEVMGIAPVERTYAVQSSSFAPVSGPQKGYQPPPPPFNPTYPPPQQDANKIGSDKEGKWSWRDWIVKVIIPVLGILATAGFFTARAINSNTPSIPQLHTNYAGTAINLTQQRQYTMYLINISEDTSNGTFTGNMFIQQCAGQVVNGIVTSTGKVTFTEDEEQNVAGTCGTFVTNFEGHINSSGGIAGTWDAPNGGGNGSFSVS